MANNENAWIAKLKVGDEVAVCYHGSFYGPRYEFSQVGAQSANFLTVTGSRYRKKDGREAGNPYHSCLVEATEQLRAQVAEKKRRQEIVNHLDAQRWTHYETAELEAIYALTKKPPTKES